MRVDGAGYCHVDQYGGDAGYCPNGRQRCSVSCLPQLNHHNRKNNLTSTHGASSLGSGFRPPVLGLRIVCIEEYAWNGQRGSSSSMRVWDTPVKGHRLPVRGHRVTRVQREDADARTNSNAVKNDTSAMASRRARYSVATIRKSVATI